MISAQIKALVTRLLFERGGRETWRVVSACELRLGELGLGYFPTPWRGLKRVFRRIAVSRDDVFADFGSGKGRVVLEAARHPFGRVIGVESSPFLHQIAEQNLARVGGRLRCRNVELVNEDAREFSVTDDLTVAFFFNPFRGEIFERVADHLAESLRRRPRVLRIVYVNPQEEAALLARGARRVEWLWGDGSDLSHSIALYELAECPDERTAADNQSRT